MSVEEEYKLILKTYNVPKGYINIRKKPRNMSKKQHLEIIKMQQFIINTNKYGYILSEFFISEWDNFAEFEKYFNLFIKSYF